MADFSTFKSKNLIGRSDFKQIMGTIVDQIILARA